MNEDSAEVVIRRAIGGDIDAIAWIESQADVTDDALVIAMGAVLARRADRLVRAKAVALTSRDRQVVAIAGAHLDGESRLVDALARDHLVDHPDSLIVAWIASDLR